MVCANHVVKYGLCTFSFCRRYIFSHFYYCVKCVQMRSFFRSVFSRIWTEYLSSYSVRMREYADQKKLRIWTLFTQCITRKQKFWMKYYNFELWFFDQRSFPFKVIFCSFLDGSFLVRTVAIVEMFVNKFTNASCTINPSNSHVLSI